jgi:tetratricopeptide (TPR) repeat protein
MPLDLSKLPNPSERKQHLNPIEIFNSLPRLKESPNDLWAAQQQILVQWHKERARNDVAINLNTGAGKSIVGLLIAQSLINEKIGPVIYCCATNDLVQQTASEAERKLGLKFTTRIRGEYSNSLFQEGKAFLITTYHTVFQPFSVFRWQLSPAAIIFDDAHVAENVIRGSMTIQIARSAHKQAYETIKTWFRDYFVSVAKNIEFQAHLSGTGDTILMVPSEAIVAREPELLAEIERVVATNEEKKYALGHLKTHIKHCFVTISNDSIEFTPAFLPSLSLPFISSTKIRRIYLSATMNTDSEFIRTFGREAFRISVDTDAGNGERLIIFVDKLKDSKNILKFYRSQVRNRKVLFAVPSGAAATKWAEFGTPPKAADFSAALAKFKAAKSGSFVLVARVDGIDLPGDTCRMMVMDGTPTGVSQLEKFIDTSLGLYDFLNSKITTRITQLFGRINRGRSDYGVFLINDYQLAIWLRRERNLALMPSTLQKQLMLGQLLNEEMHLDTASTAEFADAVMDRDEKWTNYYQSYLESMDIDPSTAAKTSDVTGALRRAAIHEARAASALWDSRYEEARGEYRAAIEIMQSIDESMVGFYMLLVGNLFGIEGDTDAAKKHYHLAEMKLPRGLVLPKVQMTIRAMKTEQLNALQRALSDVFVNDLIDANQRSHALIKTLEALIVDSTGASTYDEALKQLGATIGFKSSRPDNELKAGPDVLWVDERGKQAIAFETKIEKLPTASYSKKEIGQSHNHIQWTKDNVTAKMLGLAIVGECTQVDRAASPSDEMSFLSREKLKRLAIRVRDLVTRISTQTPLERRGSISALNDPKDFDIGEIWKQIAGKG